MNILDRAKDLEDELKLIRESFDRITSTYSDLLRDFHSVGKSTAPLFLTRAIDAYDTCGVLYSRILFIEMASKNTFNAAKAEAFLERSQEYLTKNGVKDTASARDKYVDMDKGVLFAGNINSLANSLLILIKNKLEEFKMVHDDIKKIAYDVSQTQFTGVG